MDKKRVLIIILGIIVAILVIVIACFLGYLVIQNNFVRQDETVGLVSSTIIMDGTNKIDSDNKDSSDDTYNAKEMIEGQNIYNNSSEIKIYNANEWNRTAKGISKDYEKGENGEYYYDGYTAYSDNGLFINKIIFNENYTSPIIGGLKIGTKKDEVMDTLGEPNYVSDNVYGYKTTTVYAFFYDNEIVLYPNIDYKNNDLEELLFSYIDGNYNGNQTNLVVDIRQNYEDFIVVVTDDEVILTSLVRQIQIRLNDVNDETEILIYNGYKQGNLISNYLGVRSNIVDLRQDDLVFVTEQERVDTKDND